MKAEEYIRVQKKLGTLRVVNYRGTIIVNKRTLIKMLNEFAKESK